jgi:hypothetical protein
MDSAFSSDSICGSITAVTKSVGVINPTGDAWSRKQNSSVARQLLEKYICSTAAIMSGSGNSSSVAGKRNMP